MVKCEKCGKLNLKDSKFCSGCGNTIIHHHKESTEKEKHISKSHKKDHISVKRKWVNIVIGVLGIILILFLVNNYCNQIVPKQVEETYTEQEPYTVYETQTRTQYIVKDHCNGGSIPNCVCVESYMGIFKKGCKACNCQITEQVPVTKYKNVQKTRIVTRDAKRCTFLG